ncbi:beta strand repeat-containing protein [Azospirillum himalayense]|uniref:Beta strand repeat-containing protein n=1 Tax=Azospirillum himalayense TaxID=654847 RepID=A0ABW0G2K3_9PROT
MVTIPNQPAKVGDVVTATITVASDSDTYTLGAGSTIGGFALGNLTKVNATTYTATFTVTADGQRSGDRAANQDVPVNIVLVDSASNANAAYTTAISQNNDRIDTNAPPVLAVPTTPPTLVDTAANDTFPLVSGQLVATDLEGDTLTYSVSGTQTPGTYVIGGVTYNIASTGAGGTAYVNSQTGQYAYVFDAAFLNGVPAGPMSGTTTFGVSDGNRTVTQQLTLNFTGANDAPILSTDVRSLSAIDQGVADAANAGTTVTAMLASAGTATDAEYNSPVPLVTVVPLGVAVTGVTNTHGVWQYKVGSGSWTNIPVGASNGSALLLAGSDRIRFVPSGSGFASTDTGGLVFKAWDLTSGTAGNLADTTSGSAFSTASASTTIRVDAVPTLTATGGTATFGVGASSATSLFSGVAASTVEAGQSFRGAVFTVSGVVDATEVLSIGGTDIALSNGATASLTGLGTAGGNASVTVTVVGGVATVTITGLERTDAQMSALLGSLGYKNTSGGATLGNRTVAISSLTDTGGATGSAAIANISTVVSVADVTPPSAPVVTTAALSKSATPTIGGTAEAGSTVTVTVGGATYTTTATGGAWSLDLSTATPTAGTLSLNPNGTNAVSATATDAAGNVSAPATQTLTLDTTAPGAPTVTSAALSNVAKPTVAGTAEANSTVTVSVAGATYTTTANANGGWSVNLATATPTAGTLSLNPNGANAVSATVTDAAGNSSPTATQTLTLDTTAPGAPTVTSAALSNVAKPTVAGTAEANSTVTVSVAGATYTTTANANGGWSVNLATATPTAGTLALDANGVNAVSVTARDAAGNSSPAATQTLTLDTTAPGVTVALGSNSLGVDQTTTVTFTFTEAPTGFTDDDVTVPNGALSNLAVVPGSNGLVYTAILTPAADRVAADNRITVNLGWTDAAGNAPTATASSTAYSIDTRRVDAPTLGGGVADQAVNDTASLRPFAGFTVGDSNPTQSQTVVIKLHDAAGTVGDATGSFTQESLTASGFTRTAAGTYSLTAPSAAAAQAALRRLTFQPTGNRVAPGATETTTFAVTVTDDTSLSSSDATTSVRALSVNDRPTLAQTLGTRSVDQGQAFAYTVPAGAFADADTGDTLSYSATSLDGSALPAWLSFDAATGRLSGTPGNADVGSQAVRITATDAAGAATSDVLIVQVADVNDAPVAVNDTVTTNKLTPIAVNAANGVLANDSDPDFGDRPVVSAVNGDAGNVGKTITLAGGGKLTLSADGRYTFDPAGGYASLPAGQTRQETVSYTITDRAGATSTATLTITVSGANTAPTAQETKQVAIDQNSSRVGLSIDKPVDPEGDALTVTVTGLPTIGTVQRFDGTALQVGDTLTPDQLAAVVYTPPFGTTGTAGQFTYTISDGVNLVGRAVAIDLTPVQWLSVGPSVVAGAEGNSGTTGLVFTITRHGDTSGSTTVTWQVDAPADSGLTGSLADAADFGGVLPGGTLTFAAGETSKTITIPVSGDRLVEDTELFRVALVGSTTTVANAKIEVETRTAIGTILNDDRAATVTKVTGPGAGRYLATRGDALEFTVAFTDTVGVASGTPRLTLTIGSQTRYATYDRTENGALVFRYVVAADDLDKDGIAVAGTLDLNGGRIVDSAGNTVTSLTLGKLPATDKVLVNVRGGRAIDGYIAGATVFADANANGVLDAGEASGSTDAVGNWSVEGGSGPIIMLGGTDISTNLAFTGVYQTAATASVINPLTTVVMGMAGLGGSDAAIAAAVTELKSKLGLDAGLDLLNYDPIVAATSAGASASAIATALRTQAAAANIANLIVQGSAVLTGAVSGTAPASGVIGRALVSAIAEAVAAVPAGSTFDLADTTVLATILTSAGGKVSAIDSAKLAAVVTQAASVIAAANGAVVSASGSSDGLAGLTQMAQTQVVAQGAAAAELQSGTAAGNVSNAVSTFTGSSLQSQISSATVAVVVPSRLAIAATDADKREGDVGSTAYSFTVTRAGNTSGALTVDWAVAANGTLDAADFGGTLPAGTISFADGESTKTITVQVAGDTDIEPDETFTVTLSNPSVAATALDTATASGVIRNEDPINPKLTLPTAPTAVTGQAAAIGGLTVADGDSATVTATLTPGNGTITLAGPATVGTAADGTLTVSGSVADVNATLATLVFTGAAGQTAGSLAVTLSDDDPTTPDASGTLAIALQSAPENVLPSRPTVIARHSIEILGLELRDADGGTMTVVLTPTNGTITLPLFGAATATDLGNGKIRLTGTLDDVNKTLKQLEFTGARQATTASILFETADDQPLTADDSDLLLMDVLSPPEQTVPAALAAVAGQATAVSGLVVEDFDSTTVQVTLTPTGGTLGLTAQGGASVSQPGGGAYRVVGTQADVNATLATLTYTGTVGTTAGTIQVASTDLDGRTPVVTDTIAVTIDNLPAVTVPGSLSLVAGTPAVLAGLSVSDPNNRVLTVRLSPSGGTLAVAPAAGVTITGNPDGSQTLSGLASALNTALAAATFTGSVGTAQAALAVQVDAGNGQNAHSQLAIALSASPELTLPATSPTLLAGTATAVSGLALSDTGAAIATVRLTPSNAALALTAAGGAQLTDLGGGVLAVVGTAAAVNATLATLTVTPADAAMTASVAIAADYAGGILPGVSGTLAVAVAHAPTLTLPQPVTVDPGLTTALNGILVADPDGGTLTVTLTPAQAVLAVAAAGQATVGTAAGGAVTITGSVADVNATLATLAITAARASTATIAVTVSDGTVAPAAWGTLTLPVVDRTPPGAPTIAGAFLDDAGTAAGGLINRGALLVRGVAEAGSTVALADNGLVVATVTAGADGAWVADFRAAPLPDGGHSFTAVATDAAGNTGTASTALALTVDTQAPAAPQVSFADAAIDHSKQSNVAFTIANGEVGTTYRWTLTSSGGGTLSGTGRIASASDTVRGLDVSGLYDGTLSLSVMLTDDAGNASPAASATAAKATAVTIDGAQVQTLSGQANGKTTSTVVVQAPASSRAEDPGTANATLADVPVVQETRNGSTVTTLQVSLPTGVGVTASGPAARQNPTQSLDDLVREIQARTTAGTSSRTGLEGGGRGFLGALPQTTALLVRTFDFTAATAPDTAAKITGTAQDGSLPTALVINTTAVGAPLAIQLDNVEFAAVIGQATLTGGAGNQTVFGDGADQYLLLGEGDDYLSGGGGNDTVASTLGNDTLLGDDGDDLLGGGEGDDLLSGGAGQDTLGGGAGNDTLGGGTGNDVLFGENGNDVLFGEDGNDTLFGGDGADILVGGAGDDVLAGGAGGDTFFGGEGVDTLFGQEGDDILALGAGNDIADGGDGDDTLFGEDGDDTLFGGSGADILSLGSGNDLASGGSGNDTLFGDDGDDTLFGGAGNDVLAGGAGNDVIFLDQGADTVWGGDGADLFAIGSDSGGSVVMDFTAGTDRLALFDAALNLASVIASARVVNGSTVLDLKAGVSVTILGQTGDVANWFG